MDTLDKFVTVRDGDVVMRLHKDEAPVLQEYAMPLAHQALDDAGGDATSSRRRARSSIEIFPKHDDFAVRTLGLPGMIGALGVCFGRVVTMDSPRARPPGEFQWEATLWHELAHVITLQMSNQRLPRWLTEGISVYEEKQARPEWGREMDIDVRRHAESRRRRSSCSDLNAAFQNPKTDLARVLPGVAAGRAHRQRVTATPACASWCARTRQGIDTDAALKAALNTDFDQLQAGFDQTLERMFGAMRKRAGACPRDAEDAAKMPTASCCKPYADEHPRSYPVQMALGRALRKAGQLDEAMQAFERAAALVPTARGADSPHEQMAAIAMEKKDRARAIAELTALVATDFNNVEAARQLAALLRQTERRRSGAGCARSTSASPRSIRSTPKRTRRSAAWRCSATKPTSAAREFRTVIALGPVDRAAALHRSRGELLQGRQARRGEEADARGARDRADLRARAGPAAEAGRTGAVQ